MNERKYITIVSQHKIHHSKPE